MTESAHIVATDLTMAYGDFLIQKDLNFTVNHGDVFIILAIRLSNMPSFIKLLLKL